MDDIIIDGQTLATFSNLTPDQTEEFCNSVCQDFLPAGLWDIQSIRNGVESADFAWQFLQAGLREAWENRFPLDMSIQLIIAVDKYSKLENVLSRVPEMSNQEIANMRPPAAEVWPFQRAVMYLAVNSWRARFCTRCGKRFVAVKPKSTYCSDVCFKESRKGAKQAWWEAHGENWRSGKKTVTAKRSKKGAK